MPDNECKERSCFFNSFFPPLCEISGLRQTIYVLQYGLLEGKGYRESLSASPPPKYKVQGVSTVVGSSNH